MEEGRRIHKLSNMMKEKTLLLLFDFIFKKERTKKYILKVATCENYSMLSKYPYKSQSWYTIKQELKGAFVIWNLPADCGIVLKRVYLQHRTKASNSAAGLLVLFLSISSTSISSSLRSEMKWWKLSSRRSILQEVLHWKGALFLRTGEESHACVRPPV